MLVNRVRCKKTGESRVQEWVKKLQPDVLRNRFRIFRRFVVSATTASAEKPVPSSSVCEQVASARALLRTNISMNSNRESNTLLEASDGKADDEQRLQLEIEKSAALDAVATNTQVSDAIAQKRLNDQSTSNGISSNLQLAINVNVTPRNKSPITVQEWIDSLPLTPTESSRDECDITDKTTIVPLGDSESDNLTLGAEAGSLVHEKLAPTALPLPQPPLLALPSPSLSPLPPPLPPPQTSPPIINVTVTGCQEPSEVESHCSSVDSLLEARKPDPEEVLLSLGFGGTASSNYLETGRIPKRFLQQSQLKGVDIEEFIRQQQDLIYTFESGYYGYRGLAGPSHSNPSVIVAKILEKLREHERETTPVTSYQLDFRKHCSSEKSSEHCANKFSKVARNVLTKIRCTPSSVLSPDNRKWLDSQGSKSPEIARRLIIGQKSFTFGHDGDLIEASNFAHVDGLNDEKDDTNGFVTGRETRSIVDNEETADTWRNADTPGTRCDECNTTTGSAAESTFGSCNLSRRFTDSSTDMSVESIVMRNDSSDRNASKEVAQVTDVVVKNSTLKRLSPIDMDESDTLDLHSQISSFSDGNNRNDTRRSVNDSPRNTTHTMCNILTASSLPECEIDENTRYATASRRPEEFAYFPKEISLHDELEDSGVPLSDFSSNDGGSLKKIRNILTRCSSFEESYKESSDDESAKVEENIFVEDYQSSEKTDQYADSATESEFASYSHRSLVNKSIHRQYEELVLLESKLQSLGQPVKVISRHQFSTISSEQRCAIQTHIIREALKAYLNQMTEDEIHLELKNCLSAEVQKVADLLNTSSDASKLAVIVKQMTLLLQHQSRLSAQIKELSMVEKKPTSCHEMCGHILKRVHDLELLVQQNAQELAQMKHQLLKKK